MDAPTQITETTRKRFCIQGFGSYSGEQLAAFRWGIRLPYLLCATVALIGVVLASIPLLAVLTVVAFFGIILPNHPVDYLYNYGIRQMTGGAKLPPRTPQTRFACGVATVWLAVTILLLSLGLTVPGMIWGGMLVGVAFLVGLTDICLPSMAYNWLTNRRIYPRGY